MLLITVLRCTNDRIVRVMAGHIKGHLVYHIASFVV